MTAAEREVCAEIARRERDLVELVRTLVRFDTVTHTVGDEPRDEAALQAMLAERLRAAGAAVDVWEPDMSALAGHPMVPDGLLVRRPAAARRARRGRGRRPHAAPERPRRRRLGRAARPLGARPVRRRGGGRRRARPRRLRHEGRRGVHGARGGGAGVPRVVAAGRSDREHRHGGGVHRRRRAGDGACVPGGRRDRPGAERLRRLDRLSRAACCPGSPCTGGRATPASRPPIRITAAP